MITKEQILKLDPIKDRKTIAQFFHNFFYAIPEDQWCSYELINTSDLLYGRSNCIKYCALGHSLHKLDEQMENNHPPLYWDAITSKLSRTFPSIASINNNETMHYSQATERQRVLAYLNDVIDDKDKMAKAY